MEMFESKCLNIYFEIDINEILPETDFSYKKAKI